MISVYVFQSTHPRGVRPTTRLWNFRLNRFNPRTHEGCDILFLLINGLVLRFNPRTHEGCDSFCRYSNRMTTSFNPRTHEGCDIFYINDVKCATKFQSTHPRGVRRARARKTNMAHHVSIHAPTRGATRPWKHLSATTCRFQSTHPRGVRPLRYVKDNNGVWFQSTHPRGVRHTYVLPFK